MSWSAETRISDGRTSASEARSAATSVLAPAAVSSAASTGANAGLRATWFSHSLLWDSWIDIEVPPPRLVRDSSAGIWRS